MSNYVQTAAASQPAANQNVLDISAGDLSDEFSLANLHPRLAGDVAVRVSEMFRLDDQQRARLMRLKMQFPGLRLTFETDGRGNEDWLNEVLDNLPPARNTRAIEVGRRLAVELAATLYPDEVDARVEQIFEAFKVANAIYVRRARLRRDISAILGPTASNSANTPQALAVSITPGLVVNDAGEWILVQHGEQHIQYVESHWMPLKLGELNRQIIRRIGNIPSISITENLVRDVRLNLMASVPIIPARLKTPVHIGLDGQVTEPTGLLLPVSNGILDLCPLSLNGAPILAPPTPTIFSPWYLPVAYDPQATCPNWNRFLQTALQPSEPNDRRQWVLQEFAGYILSVGDMRQEKFLILIGQGSNGKSTWLGAIEALLGLENVSHIPIENLDGGFRTANIVGKLLNSTGETSSVTRLESARIKQLVSGEPLQIDRKFLDADTVVPIAKLVFAGNALPSFADSSDGFFRRLLVMPFLSQFGLHGMQQADKGLKGRLVNELPGILNYCLDGAARLLQQHAFTPCSVCQQAATQARVDSDGVLAWVEERAELAEGAVTASVELYRDYASHCRSAGRNPFGQHRFVPQLLKLAGVARCRPTTGDRRRALSGIRLASGLHSSRLPAGETGGGEAAWTAEGWARR